MRRLSIRWRLTLWYGAVLSVILIGFSVAVYLLMQRHLLALTDATLREELDELAGGGQESRERCRDCRRYWDRGFRTRRVTSFKWERSPASPFFGVWASGRPGCPSRLSCERWRQTRPTYESVTLDGRRPVRLASRVVPGPFGPAPDPGSGHAGPNARALRELVTVFLTLGPVALASAVGGGYWLARKALSPVDRMAATAAEITATRLDRRLAEPDANDELGYLAQTFNAMIARLQRSFEEVRRFTADAAHELRTPLAAMRTEAEVALRSPRSPNETRGCSKTCSRRSSD